ncbi:hypothetical protein [Massilia glaciei]|uniref:hypothetical protein n=1 Tax=Massilia glaciei TaxID=1524097 RepID=UPI0015E7EF7E|nr:hypothetical protein [Massilia glaciei]
MLAATLGAGLYVWAGDDPAAAPEPAPAAQAPGAPLMAPALGAAATPAAAQERAARRQVLSENVQLTDHTYCDYREASKYPVESRPVADHPDQIYPNAPITESGPMRTDGGGADSKVRIQSSQSRVFLAAGEGVAFSLRATDADGKVLPLVVTRALAKGVAKEGARATPQATLAFADNGAGADAAAGDGAFAAVLAPAQGALASFNGTIRTEVRYSAGGSNGVIIFDVIHTPELPATWTGQVREATESGSLHFYLGAQMRTAGRYIVTGRVDDARGQPFALLTFNDVLPAGPNEVKLTVFGKLLLDKAPALPLVLRDVDGHLLKENTDPDRALMPRLAGTVYAAKGKQMNSLSGAEWDSEERGRYLKEFGKDLVAARAALAQFDPAQPLPAVGCAAGAALVAAQAGARSN